MSWQRLTLRFYERALREPLVIGERTLEQRYGFWIEGIDASGARHLAECAPLPGWHQESLAEAHFAWRQLAPRLAVQELGEWDETRPYWGLLPWAELPDPSVQSSVEMLLLGPALVANKLQLPSAPLTSTYEICALVQLPPSADAAWQQRLLELRDRAVRVVKVKIGRQAISCDLQRLRELREALGPELSIRLDANRLLTPEHEQLLQEQLQAWPIDYLEEACASPVRTEATSTRWPVARDESLRGLEPEARAGEVLVLKPNVLTLHRTLGWLRHARAAGGRAVLSNTYESPLSLQLYTYLYGRLMPQPEALGLGTMHAFVEPGMESEIDAEALQGLWPQQPFPSLTTWPPSVHEERLWPL